MKIVDMKCDPSREYQDNEPNPYPYGLRLSLDAESLDKLGITDLPPLGSKVAFYVCGEVCSTAESKEYGDSKCMAVQIQQMALEEPPAEEEEEARAAEKGGFKRAASKLYPGKGD